MCIRNNSTTRSRFVVVFPLLIHTYIHSNVFCSSELRGLHDYPAEASFFSERDWNSTR